MITPAHSLTLQSHTNYWWHLMTAIGLGTLSALRTWTGRQRLRSRNVNESQSKQVSKFFLRPQSRVSRNDIANKTKNMSLQYASSHAANIAPAGHPTTDCRKFATAFEVICGWSVSLLQHHNYHALLPVVWCLLGGNLPRLDQLTWSDTHPHTWLGNYAPTLWGPWEKRHMPHVAG